MPELKAYLAKRGVGTSANKEELCALAFAAHKVDSMKIVLLLQYLSVHFISELVSYPPKHG